MAEGPSGIFTLVYNGEYFPQTLAHVIRDNLDTGKQYRFKVSAFNMNGEGQMSDEMITYACEAPSQIP